MTKPPSSPGVRFTPPHLAARVATGLDPGTAVLDPACGEGALLLAAWRALGADEEAASRLWGLEIDPGIARRARLRLREEIGGAAGKRAAARVVVADALDPNLPWPGGTHILANPPWASLSGRQAITLAPGAREKLLTDWPASSSWPSLHGAFLERISQHVSQEGTGARVLLPAAVCEKERYGPLRRAVLARTELTAPPVDLGESAFEDVTEPAAMIELGPRAPGTRSAEGAWSSIAPRDRELLALLERLPRLPGHSFGDPGVHTGNAASELLTLEDAPDLPGIREGRDLLAYQLAPPRKSLRSALEPSEGLRFRIGSLERYRSVPVLLRQTADRPVAALHRDPTYFRNSLLACSPPEGLDPAFVVAVLNGSLAAAWHRLRFREARQRTFPQVKVRHLRSLPFPIADRADDPELHDAVASGARALSRGQGDDAASRARLDERLLTAAGLPEPALRRIRALAR